MTRKVLRGPGGIKLILDQSEVFPDDPGNGTPAIVQLRDKTSTFWCAQGTGVIDDYYRMNAEQSRWLDEQEDELMAFLYPEFGV